MVKGVNITLDDQVLGQIREVRTEGIRSVEEQFSIKKLLFLIGKLENLNRERVFKKQMKGEYQLVTCGQGIAGIRKQMITLTTLEEGECVCRHDGVGGQSMILDLISAKEKSNTEVERLTGLLAQRDAEITCLKDSLHKALDSPIEELRPMNALL
ncbi:hypothetical protein HAX54_038319 [Datura stramonium]|uniref:Uncharacterized protein n=1 Tax=Datura stramonium TaxID=4076 RepID=A0ABS8VN13_DATST|nr:hypothetical protein [Datura stramonium]